MSDTVAAPTPSAMASGPPLPLAQAYHPITFLERGVAVPFTTPALLGARARPAKSGGLELIVFNPAGGRGVYILPWTGVCQMCRPTVHDTLLNWRVAALRGVTPGSIRRAAREIAAEGLAGHDAVTAAGAAADGDRRDRLVSNSRLLLALVNQVEPELLPALRDHSIDLELRARRAVTRIGPRIGRSPEDVVKALEELARAFAGIGASGQTPPPRIIRLLTGLHRLRSEMLGWSAMHLDDSAAQAAMIAACADLTVTCAEQTLGEAQALTQDMMALLLGWIAAPDVLADRIARPAWLVDGWEQICLIWQRTSTDVERRAALLEMALLVPVLPREASDWTGTSIESDIAWHFRKTVKENEDWRSGPMFERIARNEEWRAMAL
jgi:hypothetical protein